MISLITLGVFLVFQNMISLWLITGILIGYILFLLIVSTNVKLNFFVRAHNGNPYESERRVAITFDDGPVENTIEILRVLEKYNVKASFFCIGRNIEKNPDIFKSVLGKGHFIGNHSYSHTRTMGFLSTKKIINEIKSCDDICEKLGGVRPKTFRPPFGVINPKTQRALLETKHQVIGWNIRSYDAVLRLPDYILKRIIKRIKPGDVILLHDNNLNTVYILEQLLIFLKKNNYTPVRVDNLFQIDAYY